jgi:hypothetical protein
MVVEGDWGCRVAFPIRPEAQVRREPTHQTVSIHSRNVIKK